MFTLIIDDAYQENLKNIKFSVLTIGETGGEIDENSITIKKKRFTSCCK